MDIIKFILGNLVTVVIFIIVITVIIIFRINKLLSEIKRVDSLIREINKEVDDLHRDTDSNISEVERSISDVYDNIEKQYNLILTTQRVMQMLLTWMQDKKEDVVLIFTANSVQSLCGRIAYNVSTIDREVRQGIVGSAKKEKS